MRMKVDPATTTDLQTHEHTTGRSASAFELPPPELTYADRLLGLFSDLSRARMHLWKAYHTPSAAARRRVEKVVHKLRESRRITDPETQKLLHDLLTYLAWRDLQDTDLQSACGWLHELDHCNQTASRAGQRSALRLAILQQLYVNDDTERYAEEAKRFLADPAVRKEEMVAVRDIVRTCYEDISPEICRNVLAASNSALHQSRAIRSLSALCECPQRFDNFEEATEWASKVDLKQMQRGKILADALLVHARAAEWREEFDEMEKFACKAVAEVPEHSSAQYWVTRAQLYRTDNMAAAGWPRDDFPTSPEWSRLRKLVALRQTSGLNEAEAALLLLQDSGSPIDRREHELAVRLIRHATRVDLRWSDRDVAHCADICQHLQPLLGTPSWTQPPIAYHEICVGGQEKYVAAIGRLEEGDVVRQEYTSDLARLARILVGAVREPKDPADEHPFTAVEMAMVRTLSHNDDHSFTLRSVPPNIRSLDGKLEKLAGSRWCQRFSHLATVVRLLRYALGLSADATNAVPQFPEPPGEDAPPWIVWLYSRFCVMRWTVWQTDLPPGELDVSQPEVASVVQGWWALYGRASGSPPPIVVSSWRTLGYERGMGNDGSPLPPYSTNKHLGPLCESLIRRESKLAVALHRARKEIAEGHAESALKQLIRVCRGLQEFPHLVVIWWGPALDYYCGVALTRCDPARATEVFRQQENGPKGQEARAQMALLALKEGNLDAAAELVREKPIHYPAALFAQALLAERRGDAEEARKLLHSYDINFGETESPYRLACRRLLAALEERQGELPEAERLHRETLKHYPDDQVTSVRLGHLLLHKHFANGALRDLDSSIGLLLRGAADSLCPYRPVQLLHSLLTAPPQDLQNIEAKIDELGPSVRQAFAWSQITTCRLLELREPDRARKVLESHNIHDAPAWHVRTRKILQAWFLCKHVWMPGSLSDRQQVELEAGRIVKENETASASQAEDGEVSRADRGPSPQILAAVKALSGWFQRSEFAVDDSVAGHWQCLLDQVTSLCEEDSSMWYDQRWEQLQPWPMAAIPALWASRNEMRTQAADVVATSLEAGDLGWQEEQRTLLRTLTAWIRNRDDEYLETYTALESVLEALPVRGVDLWLAASTLWFQRKNWQQLLETNLPACVADLADPNVRVLIGLAYARSACEQTANGDERSALRTARRARATLEEFVPPSDK